MLSACQNLNRLSWSPRKIMVKDLRQRSGLAWFCACAESWVVFNTGPYIDLPDNSILITANIQSETGFPSRHQLNSYVASKSRLKLAARCTVSGCWPSCNSCNDLLFWTKRDIQMQSDAQSHNCTYRQAASMATEYETVQSKQFVDSCHPWWQ